MTESQARSEAMRRWGSKAFVRDLRLRGPGTDLYVVGMGSMMCGVGNSWEAAFQDANVSEPVNLPRPVR